MKRRTRVLREDNYRAESNVLFPSPRGSGNQGLKALFVMLGVCLAGGAWGQDLQIGGKIVFRAERDGNNEIYTMNADGTSPTRLTNNSASDEEPSWSPDATKVVFLSNRDGNNEIYVMNADGSSPTRLTSNSSSDTEPNWSPDGTKIAFRSDRDGNSEIYVMNADGSGQTRLTNNSAAEAQPSWSPDGAKIAFGSTRDSGGWEIYTMNVDGSNQTRLTSNSVSDLYPSWSPDGTKITYPSNGEIYVMNADGSGQVNLTNHSANDETPSWSPDGTKIAFTSDRSAQYEYEIYVINADGSGQTRLTNDPPDDSFPAWAHFRRIGSTTVNSSTSRTMTIQNTGSATLNVSNITSSDGQFTISPTNFSVNAGSSQNVTVTFAPTSVGTKYSTLTITSNDLDAPTAKLTVNGTATAAPVPVFAFGGSLTNSRIVFESDRDGNREIYSMNADGTSVTRLTNNSAADQEPVWSPDGTKIAFHSNRDGNYEIYVMNVDGTNQTRLTNISARDDQPSWSPDGTKITFTSERDGGGDASKEIYVMNADGTNQTRLTNNTVLDGSSSWSPDGTKIVFASKRDGNDEIYVMNADGTNQTRLTSNSPNEAGANWSPDGTKIVYQTQFGGNYEIYVMNADGTGQTRLTNNSANDGGTKWSPDGSKIAFYSNRDGNDEIYTMNSADGSSQTRITNNSAGDYTGSWTFLRTVSAGTVNAGSSGTATFTVTNRGNATLSVSGISVSGTDAAQFSPSPTSFSLAAGASQIVTVTFSPSSTGAKSASLSIAHNAGGSPATVALSGTGVAPDLQIAGKIAFSSYRDGNYEVYSMNPDGTSQTNLTNNPAHDFPKSWSPDGSKIVFYSNRDGNNEIYLMNADGTNQIRLTINTSDDYFPSWSPDGNKIVFKSERDANGEIYVMNTDGSGQTRLTNNSWDERHLNWSPDGSKILFDTNRDGNYEVYVMNADGSGQTRLTSNPAGEGDQSWSPDGSKIAFSTNRDGNTEIYVMNADGTNQTNLTNNPAGDDGPYWSPDGTKVVFMSNRDGNGEIYVMNLDGTSQTRLTNNAAADFPGSWAEAFRRIGGAAVGSPVSRTMTIENKGDGTLNVSNITSSDGQFTVSPTSFSVAPGSSQNVTVTFTPTSGGVKYSTLTISSNDGDAPTARLTVNGTGQETTPIYSPSATSVSVSSAVTKGASGTTTFTVTNTGGGTLSVSNITSNNSQFTASPTSFNLTAGVSQTVTVTFAPAKVGWEQGTLSIAHNAAGSPAAVAVSGIGRVNPPSGSLSNTRIAFQSSRDGNDEIYVMNTDGTSQTRLTNNSASDAYPSWSPDGTKITFASNRDGNNEIYTMNPDGTSQTRLTNNSASDTYPSWSPDGTKILFDSDRDGNWKVYTMNADGTGQIRLTNNSTQDYFSRWSPDGTKISFRSERDGNGEIYVMSADGTNQTRLTNTSTAEGAPFWSPDGTKIVFYSGATGPDEIYVMNADGTNQTRLTNNAGQFPSWSPFITTPTITLSSTSVSAGSVNKGASGTATFTVTNSGGGTLSVSNITSNNPQFTASPTSFNLTAGVSQTVTVTFVPTSGTPQGTVQSGTLTLSHNAAPTGTSSTVSASGTGVDPAPATPAGLAATPGNAQVSLSWTANAETDLSHYVVYRSTADNFTLAASDSIARVSKPTVTYTNTGLGAGTYYFKLAAVDSAGNKSAFSSQASAAITILVKNNEPAPSTLTFTGSGSLAVTVSDSGNTSLSLTPTIVGTEAAQFSVSPNAATMVLPGAAQSFTVTFAPSPASGNNRSATLSLAHNATNKASPLTVTLIGDVPPNAPAGLSAIPGNNQASLSWTASVENDLSHYVIYRGTSTSALGDSVGRVNQPATSFTNTGLSAGTYYYKIKAVDTGGSKSGESNPVQAIIAPAIAVSQTALVFGGVQVNTSKVLSFTVGNGGTSALSVSSIALSGPGAGSFSVTPSTVSINPGEAARTVTVTYAPAAARKDTATLTLTHNAAPTATTTALTLTGEGSSVPVPVLSPGSLAFGNVKVGQNKALALTVTNNSSSSISVTQLASSDPAFALSTTSFSLPASGSSQVTLTFTPTDRNARSATLTLTYATPTGTATVTAALTGQGMQPEIAVTPADSLRFGSVRPGQRAEQALTVTNPGNDTLTVSSIQSSNGLFTVSPASFNLAGGGSRTVSVTFAPTTTRTDTGTVTINSNARSAKVGLSGRGALIGFVVRPTSLDFGKVWVGSARRKGFRVSNPGNLQLEVSSTTSSAPQFSATPRTFNLNGGDSLVVAVNFAPLQPGAVNGTLTLGGNTDTARVVEVHGEGVQVQWPDSLIFDQVLKGESGDLNLVLTNPADDTLKVTSALIDKAQLFAVLTPVSASAPLLVLPNSSQGIGVRFTPTRDAVETGNLTLSTNAGAKAVSLKGRGVVSDIALRVAPADFGKVQVGQTRSAKVFLVNRGTSSAAIDSLQVVPSTAPLGIVGAALPATVKSGDSTEVATVEFRPVAAGLLSGVVVRAVGRGIDRTVSLQGRGVAPRLEVDLDSLVLGPVAMGNSASQALTLSNAGTDTLHISRISSSEGVFSPSAVRMNLAPGADSVLTVTFRPTPEGALSGRLEIASDDPASPLRIPLRGTITVIPPILSFSPADTLFFGVVAPGGNERQFLRLRNRGRSPLKVTLSSESEEFVPVQLDTIRLAAQDSTRTLIRFTPSRSGTRLGTLVLSSNDPEVPLATLPLKGTGGGLRVEPPSVDFGEVALGSQVDTSLTVINQTANRVQLTLDLTGLGFTIDPKSLNLEPNASGRVRVRFQPPVASDSYSGSVTVRGTTQMVTLSGVGQEGPDIDVLPSRDFGEVEVGTVGAGTLTVRNVGRGPLRIFDLIPSRLEYRVAQADSLPMVIPAGEDHGLQVFFTPDTSGEFRGTLSIVSNDPDADEREVIRTLNGRGRIVRQPQPCIEVVIGEREDDFSFGLLDEGEERALSLVLRNGCGGVLRVERIEADNGQVSADPESLVVAAGESRRVGVGIRAQQGQPQEGVVRIVSNDQTHPVVRKRWRYDRPVPGVILLTERLVFGPVEEGQRSALLAVHNRGNARLVVDLVDDSRQLRFAEDRLVVEAGQVARVQVGYGGSGGSGAVVLATNDPGRRQLTVPWNAEQVLELVRSVPEGGATSVARQGILSLFFNQPLKQVGSLAGAAGQGGGLIALQGRLVPEPLNPWRRQMRLAGSEVQIPLELEANTTYRLIVVDAESQSGAKLGSPFEVSFSTGRSAPALGSIAGSVRWSDGSPLAGTVFVASEQRELVGSARIGTEGSFTVSSVPAGSYSLFAQEEGTGLSAAYDQTVRVTAGGSVVGVAISVPVQAPVVVAVAPLDEAVALPEELPALNADSTFVLAFRTEPVQDLTGFAIEVSFDPSKVYLVEANGDSGTVKNALYGSGGFPLFLNRVVDEGTVEFGGALLGAKEATAPDGGGLLAVFTFKALDTQGYGVKVDHVIRRTLRGEDRVEGRSIGGRRGSGADFDGSGVVDFGDFFLFADAFGQQASGVNAKYDLDQSGTVDFGDFFIFADAFGKAGGATAKLLALAQQYLGLPASPSLAPAYPNPFNPETVIRYQLAAASMVKLAVYNVLGQPVRVLVAGVQAPGSYQVVWDGRDQGGRAVASGSYFLRLEAGAFSAVQKMALVR